MVAKRSLEVVPESVTIFVKTKKKVDIDDEIGGFFACFC